MIGSVWWSYHFSSCRPHHYYHLLLWEIFTPVLADRFSLEFEWQQDSRTLLSILNNTVVWMGSCPLISKSSIPFTNPWGIVPRAPTTIGITVTFMFHSLFFFSSLANSTYLSPSSLSFIFTLWFAGTTKSTIRLVFLFIVIIITIIIIYSLRVFHVSFSWLSFLASY